MGKLLTSLLGGVWGYVAAAAVAASLATGATYYIVHNANAATIAGLKLQQSQEQTASVTASLTKLNGFISGMNTAAAGYQSDLSAINANFAALQKGLKNATAAKPLPPDCVPDSGRLSILTSAVTDANNATAP